MTLIHARFEVFGKVQLVSFRNYTHAQAETLRLMGWCENTPQGTVRGELEGPKEAVDQMRQWLRFVGSPKSKVERLEWVIKDISDYSYEHFRIRR